MNKDILSYIKYLTSNMILMNDYIEKFGIDNDNKIIECINEISIEMNSIYNRMREMGIEVYQIHDTSYDVEKNIRDFKIKTILTNEGN